MTKVPPIPWRVILQLKSALSRAKPTKAFTAKFRPGEARAHARDALDLNYESKRALARPLIVFRSARITWTLAAIVGLALVDAVLARREGMSFVGWERFCLIAAVPGAVAIYYQVSKRSEQLADTGYYISAWLAFSVFGCILTYVVARADLSLRDTQLAHCDKLLSFDWHHWTSFIISHRKLELVFALAYSTILPQTLGSVIYFSHVGRPDRNDDLLWTSMLAAIITTILSALVPAMGPHLSGQNVVWSATLAAIRNHSATIFRLEHLQGIIDFPSFHTVAAILLVYSHRPPLRSFHAILTLNVLMLLSIPSEGQHYLVDILSGAIVAATSIAAVRLTLRSRATVRGQCAVIQ